MNCSSYTKNTWTYTGFNNSNGLPLNETTDQMKVDSATGRITVFK
jgi:hypothetical protein